MSKFYLVSVESKVRVGMFFSLDKAKFACLDHFEKTGNHRYTILVYNTKLNRVTRTHYSFCSWYHDNFSNCDFRQFCLDYGK